MITLALDASGTTAGVCVLRRNAVLFTKTLDEGLTHSQTLLGLVHGALDECGLGPRDVHVYGVTAGPGSFTGLRIGLSLVKGLAQPYGTPVAPVSTLWAMAAGFEGEGTLLPSLNARRGEVYWAAFKKQCDGLRRLTPDAAQPAAQAAAFLKSTPALVALLGDGARLCEEAMGAENTPHITLVGSPNTALGAALYAKAEYEAGRAGAATAAKPNYLRLSQAQRERAERLARLNIEG